MPRATPRTAVKPESKSEPVAPSTLILPTDTALAKQQSRAKEIEQQVRTLVIHDDTSLQLANETLVMLGSLSAQVETRRKFFVKPIRDHLKDLDAFFRQITDPIKSADAVLREKIVAYRQQAIRAANDARIAAEKAASEKLEAEARLLRARTEKSKQAWAEKAQAAQAAQAAAQAATTVAPSKATAAGGAVVAVHQVWDFEVMDVSLLPREYMAPVDRLIRNAVNAGLRTIPGVRVFQTERLVRQGGAA